MKTAFLMTTRDETSGRVKIEIVEHGSRAVLYCDEFDASDVCDAPGNRTRAVVGRWTKARGKIARWCTANSVMLTNPPETLVTRLIREIKPFTINQHAAIGDIVASACEPKNDGGAQ